MPDQMVSAHESCIEHKATIAKMEEAIIERDKLWVAMEGKVGNRIFYASLSLYTMLLIAILGWTVQSNVQMEKRIEENRKERVEQLSTLNATLQDLRVDVKESQVLLRQVLQHATGTTYEGK